MPPRHIPQRTCVACRTERPKRDMVRNNALPAIEVDPETFAVTADGVLATVPPAESLRVNRLYFFS